MTPRPADPATRHQRRSWPRRGRFGFGRIVLAAGLAAALCRLAPGCAVPAAAAMLGANKFDLALDYVAPAPPPQADPDGYRRVRQAMGHKAILDARDAGLAFLRVAVTGFFPNDFTSQRNDLALWQEDPPRFWSALDHMFDDLDAAGVRLVPSLVWNLAQFPALAHEDVATFIRDAHSPGRRLMARFIGEFVARYRARRTILFYEMGNEFNLQADINLHRRCRAERCVWSDFTSADLDRFAAETAALIKQLDPSRSVSSGYSLPRKAAAHLASRPQFAPGGAKLTVDTPAEFEGELASLNRPFDIVSIHVYPDDETRPAGPRNRGRFDPLARAAQMARAGGKRLFVGEFGDKAGATPFLAHTLDDIVSNRVDFAAIWAWEFYRRSPYAPAEYNVEPGYSDRLIDLLRQTAGRLGAAPPRRGEAAPRVVLTWPLPCARTNGPIELHAVASDDGHAVAALQFWLDGKLIASPAAPPYAATFDPAGLGSRSVAIEARAIGRSGATAAFRSTVRLNGNNDRCRVGG